MTATRNIQQLDAEKARVIRSPLEWLAARTLSTQFLIGSGLVVLLATISAGYLTTRLVSDNALSSKAGTTALLLQSVTEAMVQDLSHSKSLAAANIARLDTLFADPEFKARFPHFEVWTPDGTVAYSRAKEMIGQRFDPPPGLTGSLAGEIVSTYANLNAAEHALRNINTRFLEIYSPLHDQATGRIIGVAEIHEDPTSLNIELRRLRQTTWATVALFSGFVMFGLFTIVRRGSQTIESQRQALRHRAEEAELTSRELMELRDRASRASMELANMNEQFMRRIGADLHDGPVQLVTLAILQLGHVSDMEDAADRNRTLDGAVKILSDVLAETRSVTRSLLLPEITHLAAHDIIAHAIRQHEGRTGTSVRFIPKGANADLPPAVKTCLYRFVQEGLTNAYRHAGGNGQTVRCLLDIPLIEVSIEDDGLPPGVQPLTGNSGGMGIYGLRQRIESFGGKLLTDRRPNGGTVLQMKLELQDAHHQATQE